MQGRDIPLQPAVLALGIALIAFATTPAFAADPDINELAGVYKKTFKNGNISGDKYDSENILEIVKVSPKTAYVRIHLEFFNGHVCDIWGVAKADSDGLVYRGENNAQGARCVLTVKAADGKVTLQDNEGACAIGTCGMRGMYSGMSFEQNRRRAIRYMDILLKSDQYKDAIDEFEGKPRTRLP